MGRDNANLICLTQVLYIMFANITILYKMYLANLKHSNPSFEPDLLKLFITDRPNRSKRTESARAVLESTKKDTCTVRNKPTSELIV